MNVFRDRYVTITCDEISGTNTQVDSLAKTTWSDGPVAAFPIRGDAGVGQLMDYRFTSDEAQWVSLTAKQPIENLHIRLRRDFYESFGPNMIDWTFVMQLR